MRSRKLLALLFCLITFPAIAGYMTLLGAGVGSIAPVASWVSTTDPTFPSSSLTFSRTSLATMFDSTGKLTYAPNNLLTYSQTWANPAWAKTAATVVVNLLTDDTSTGAHLITGTNVGVSSGFNAIFAVWASKNTKTQIALQFGTDVAYFDLNAGTVISGAKGGIVDRGDGSYICYIRTVPANNNTLIYLASGGTVSYTGTGNGSVYIYDSYASAVTYETSPRTADQVITTSSAYYGPRIDYDPNTLAVKGLLIEEARTNLAIQSTLASGWSVNNVTATTDATKGSDGTTASTKLTATAATAQEYLYRPAMGPTATGTAFTLSIETDGSSGAFPFLSIAGDTGNNLSAVFDITTAADGTATQTQNTGSGSLASTSQKYLGGGRYRLSVTGQVGSIANPFAFFGLAKNKTGNTIGAFGAPSGTFAGTEYVYFTFVQFEAGSFATSYIPTAAASVTRAADVVQFTGAALTALQGSAGSAIVQMTDQSVGYSATGGVVLGGSSTYWLDLANGNMYSNSGSHFLNTANAAVAGSPYRASVAWNASGRSLAMNGGTVATDAFGGWAATTPYLGSLSGTANFANGHVASFAIYNQRLPDATLQAKSVVGASYAANDNGLRFADNDNLPIHWRIAL